MKVYVVVYHDYEASDWGPVFATRELAEEFASSSSEIEEWEILERMPQQVPCYYAQRQRNPLRIVTGSNLWWDYDLPDNDVGGDYVAWSCESESHARRLLAVKEGRRASV